MTLLVDVDDLKAVNDTYGHAAGDAGISDIGACLRAHSRPGDVCVRWGGDEFLLLAADLDDRAGLDFAGRSAQAVRASSPDAPWQHLRMSVSIGVCGTLRSTLPLDRLDAARYGVKRAGRGHAALAPAP